MFRLLRSAVFRNGVLVSVALVTSVGALAQRSAIGESAVGDRISYLFDHVAGFEASIVQLGAGVFEVEVSCVGCLLDVRVEKWSSADDARARAQVDGVGCSFQVRAGQRGTPADVATIAMPTETPGTVTAFDVVMALEQRPGIIREERITVFGKVVEEGALERINWETWVCASGFATCEASGEDGQIEVVLGGVSEVPE